MHIEYNYIWFIVKSFMLVTELLEEKINFYIFTDTVLSYKIRFRSYRIFEAFDICMP